MSKADELKNLFPNCPICGSSEGYAFSVFYPNVQCKSCKSEWAVYEYGMELKATRQDGLIKQTLDKTYSFSFWRMLEAIKELPVTHRIFAPVDYVGGAPEHVEPTKGYIVFESEDALVYRGREAFLNKVEVKILVKDIQELKICKRGSSNAEKLTHAIALGAVVGGLLETPETWLLILSYLDSSGFSHDTIFDFYNNKKPIEEFSSLLNNLRKKTQG